MITARAFAGKHYAVYGLARSGLATVEALLASVQQRAASAGVTIRTEVLEAANVERALLRAAADADLMVLGAATRPHAKRSFFGTHVEAVLAEAPCPVAVLLLPT